jgi:hypothetical protein
LWPECEREREGGRESWRRRVISADGIAVAGAPIEFHAQWRASAPYTNDSQHALGRSSSTEEIWVRVVLSEFES